MIGAAQRLAIDGGRPVRDQPLPYGRQWVDADDVAAVVRVLSGDWLTTGPAVAEFEAAFAKRVGSRAAVAVSHGTAALHSAMHALGVGPGDEVIVPAMTFAATANAVVMQGATPVFADVSAGSLLVDVEDMERKITPRTKALVAVDYAGQPCDYDRLRQLATEHRLALVSDGCHSLGASYKGRAVGTLAELTAFSLHPVKAITAGEGGIVATDDVQLARRMAAFRNHGFSLDHRQRQSAGTWQYEMTELGWNYRLTDMQAALATSQLRKLDQWTSRRREIAARYDAALVDMPWAQLLTCSGDVEHAYHLYVVRLSLEQLSAGRAEIFAALRAEGSGVNVHYLPVHLHPYYQQKFGTRAGQCPVAEDAYERILSLPIFPRMTNRDVEDVIEALAKVLAHFAR